MLYKIYKTYPKRVARNLIEKKKFRPIVYYFLLEICVMFGGFSVSVISVIHNSTLPSYLWLIIAGVCLVPLVSVILGISLHSLSLNKKKISANDIAKDVVTVILAGGKSSRLQTNYPEINKFLNVHTGNQTLIESTLSRNWKFVNSQNIVTTDAFASIIRGRDEVIKYLKKDPSKETDNKKSCQLLSVFKKALAKFKKWIESKESCWLISKIKDALAKKEAAKNQKPNRLIEVIPEPQSRGTATAIYFYLWKNPHNAFTLDPIIVILPSDHVIPDLDGYTEAIKKACDLARDFPNIYLLGLRPSSDSDLYGHIVVDRSSASVLKVKDFKEKPPLEEIASLKEHGMVLWNMGVFIARRSVFLELYHKAKWPNLKHFSKYDPESKDFTKLYKGIDDSSFDADILQKVTLKNLYVVPASFNWVDVGDPTRLQVAVSDALCKIENVNYMPKSDPVLS